MFEFTAKLIHLFFQDRAIYGSHGAAITENSGTTEGLQDIAWYGTDGKSVQNDAWAIGRNRSLVLMLNGKTLQVTDEEGCSLVDDSFLVMVNAAGEDVEFSLPPAPSASDWRHLIDTGNIDDPFRSDEVGEKLVLGDHSMMVLTDA